MSPGALLASGWGRRLGAAALTAAVTVTLRAPRAAASPLADDPVGQTPPALSWIDLKDSRGISIWNFEMSLDRGGGLQLATEPQKVIWSTATDLTWGLYRSVVAMSLWFLDWVLSFTWVSTIAAPLLAVGDGMQAVLNRLGLVPTFLSVTALLAGVWFLKGKLATATWEIAMACLIAALATGVFAHPVELVAGPDGYIVKASQTGQELAAELVTSGGSSGKTPEQLRQAQTAQLVDTFVRQPTELVNFGRVLDGGKCESAYNTVLKQGPYGNESDIRDAVSDCDEALGEYAANPSAGMALGSVLLIPAGFVVLFMGLVFAGSVVAAAVWAMFQSLKAVVSLITGLLPGGGRGSLMLTVAETVVALLVIIFTSVFLSVFLLVIREMFASNPQDAVAKTFMIVDVLLVVGVVVYWRYRKQLQGVSQRMAAWMSQRPGASPTSLPGRVAGGTFGGAVSRTAALGIGYMHARARMLDARKPPPQTTNNLMFLAGNGGRTPAPGPGPYMRADPVRDRRTGPRGGPPPQLPGPSSHPQLPPGPGGDGGPPRAGGGLHRATTGRKVTGVLARAGARAALAYATGGASTVLTGTARAAKAAQTTRRVALAARLAAAGVKGPSATNTFPARPTGPTDPRQAPPAGPGLRSHPARGEVIPGEVVRPTSPASPIRGAAPDSPRAARRTTPLGSRTVASSTTPLATDAAAHLHARLADRTRRRPD